MKHVELYGTSTVPTPATCASGWRCAAPISSNTTWRPTARRRERMRSVAGGQRTVPVLVEDGAVVQVGWQGRGCTVGE